MKPLLALALVAAASALPQDMPPVAEPGAQHEWLQQLVGEWTIASEGVTSAEQPPMEMQGEETVRALGGLWVIAEGRADIDGATFESRMTLGYDQAKEAFVGTWVDTMQTHMWVYRGQLDESGKSLALEAEGPSFTAPGETATYRDTITIQDEGTRVLTSAVKGDDGEWFQFARTVYMRK